MQDFFIDNLYWIVGIAVFLIFAFFIGLETALRAKKSQGAKSPKPTTDKTVYLEALGGSDNILSHTREGSRIVLTLRDYTKIDRDKIKEAGVTGFIERSDRLTLVVKDHAEAVYHLIFGD